ncbi:hypothetical protein V5F79_02565 [Xanthobacter flavus]|uniref:ABC transporter permease n=1 Tax=Xanthobacter flavus TaxID=281 RepID=UPI0037264267
MQRPRHAPTRHAPARHAAETWAAASGMHARVVGAVIMRDLQTRFGTGYFGFLLGLIMPLGHLTIAMVIMTVLGRLPPIGTSNATFSMTGVLPFVLWLYSHRQIMIAYQQNRPLLYFPGVDIGDLLAARVILEISSGTLVVVFVLSALALMGYDVMPAYPAAFLGSLIAAWVLGIATGLIFGNGGALFPGLLMLGNLLGPLFWITSGIVYLPDLLPERAREAVSYFPLCQAVDMLRFSFYPEYYSSFYDPYKIYPTLLFMVLFGSALVPIVRKVT